MKEKCSKCKGEAKYFDINLQAWVCEQCFTENYQNVDLDEYRKTHGDEKYNEEIDNMLMAMNSMYNQVMESKVKAVAKRFEKTAYSLNLNDILESMTRVELSKIAEALDFKQVYKYNKKDLKALLSSSYREKLIKKLEFLDEKSFKVLKRFTRNNGENILDNLNDDMVEYVEYFMSIGVIFPSKNHNNKSVVLMPLETQEIITSLNEFEYRFKIKNNTKIIKLYRGMINAYGVLEECQIMRLIKKYVREEYSNKYLSDLLKAAAEYDENYEVEGVFAFNSDIADYIKLYNDINNKSKGQSYKEFSEKELLSLGKDNWIKNNIYSKEFERDFSKYFVMDERAMDDILTFLYCIIQEKSLEEVLKEARGMVEEEEAKDIAEDIVRKYIMNLPIWTNKGKSISEVIGMNAK